MRVTIYTEIEPPGKLHRFSLIFIVRLILLQSSDHVLLYHLMAHCYLNGIPATCLPLSACLARRFLTLLHYLLSCLPLVLSRHLLLYLTGQPALNLTSTLALWTPIWPDPLPC
jgi:hypothetical protein